MLDPKEERKYDKLRKAAQELHIPFPETFIKAEVFDKDGRLIQLQEQRGHSWVRNAYNHMFGQLAGKCLADSTFGAGLLSIKEIAGVVKFSTSFAYGAMAVGSNIDNPVAKSANSTSYRGVADNDDIGILIGTGTNAESFEDYCLQTLIPSGTGAGQMSYVQSEPHSIVWAAGTKILKNDMVRYFNNNSGGSIGIEEIGLACRAHGGVGGSSAYNNVLQSRDKLGATVTVPTTGQLKVTYTIQLTYPA